jgi:FMN-dependent NADH-azoreductase
VKLLHIDSSILGENSVSRLLTAEITKTERAVRPDVEVTYRDLAASPLGHYSAADLPMRQGRSAASPEEHKHALENEAVLAEFLAADIVVVGAPMYNLSIPSQLKAWFDRIAVAGKTFRYTANGPQGLAGSKRVIVASSRGGFYGPGTPGAALEHQESYLRAFFKFLGITDVTIVRAEGVNISPEQRTKSIDAAKAELTSLQV